MHSFRRHNDNEGKLADAPRARSVEHLTTPRNGGLPADSSSNSRSRYSAPASLRRANSHSVGTQLSRLSVVVPAHNEEHRIGKVLETLTSVPGIDQVIVVNDGSTDQTLRIARSYAPAVTVIDLPENVGKGGAMLQGACAADCADIVLFLDADLIGLTCEHVRALAAPVMSGEADMSVGQFRGGRGLTDLAQFLVPYISGQRAIRRSLFMEVPDLDRVGYGIEMAITLYVKSKRGLVETVTMRGVTHPMKEEKLGFIRGARARLHMYAQMCRFALKFAAARRRR